MKKGAGNHNLDSNRALEHIRNSINLKRECKGLLHKRSHNEGEVIDQTLFNRQGNGIQSSCSNCKTLIDRLKHRFWRFIGLYLTELCFNEKIDNKYYTGLLSIELIAKNSIVRESIYEVFHDEYFISLVSEYLKNTNIENYCEISIYLENKLKLKYLNLYKIYFDNYETAVYNFNKFESSLSELTKNDNFEDFKCLMEILLEDTNYYVKETSTDNTYYSASDVSFNISKLNNLYEEIDGVFIKTKYRVPLHNTKASVVGNTNRLRNFLTPVIDRQKINKYKKEYKDKGHQLDHRFPIALGGQESPENLKFITTKENLKKKDSFTYEVYLDVIDNIDNLVSMISYEIYPVFSQFYLKVKRDESLFNSNVRLLEAEIKNIIKDKQENFYNSSMEDKIRYLQQIRPDLSPYKVNTFISKFNSNYELKKQANKVK